MEFPILTRLVIREAVPEKPSVVLIAFSFPPKQH